MGLDALVPLVETSDGFHGETLASGMANLLSDRAIAAGSEHRSLVSAHGVSGQPYSELRKCGFAVELSMLVSRCARVTRNVVVIPAADEARPARASLRRCVKPK